MKQVDIENQLREVVGRLITEVDLATNQGRSDVNLISEDAWIPILKEVYQCQNLINLNRRHRNFPGIDLGDEQDRVAFQVTASTDMEKVKSTLEKFKKYNHKNAFDELYIFTIRTKQKSYSQDAIDKISAGVISFNAKKHIIDPGDILSEITRLRLPAQVRMLEEFRTILGDIEASVKKLNSPENVPYVLVSNLIKVCVPNKVYMAELSIDEKNILSAARRDLGYQGKRPKKSLLVKFALLIAGLDKDGWVIYENKIFTFYDMEQESAFLSIIDIGTVEELTSEDLIQHELVEYQNLFKHLMKNTVKDQLKALYVSWSKEQRQFYFLPDDNESQQRKVEWVGKKVSRRTVYEVKFQKKNPEKVAHFKHQSFDLSFINIASDWYAAITPSWYYTWNLYSRNRFHDDLLSTQKRLEHNHSVRDQVRFIGHFLANNTRDTDNIRFEELMEFRCFSQISLDEDESLLEDTEEEIVNAN